MKLNRLDERITQAIADLEAQNTTDDSPPPPRLPTALEAAQALAQRVRTAREGMEPGASGNCRC